MMPPIFWQRLEAFSAQKAAHAFVGEYELIAFVIARDPARGDKVEIGFEIYQGCDFQRLIMNGSAESFMDAKARAEAALKTIIDREET